MSIHVTDKHFHLSAPGLSYHFHIADGDVIHDHFGAPTATVPVDTRVSIGPQANQARREFPDVGRGDMRLPAVHIAHGKGTTVTRFQYTSHEIGRGKQRGSLPGLPATFGAEDDVATLRIHLADQHAGLTAVLDYAVFKCGAIARSARITNASSDKVTIHRAASAVVDFGSDEKELVGLYGNWSRECMVSRRKVEHGFQGFQSLVGYSSHLYNPFFALVSPSTTEDTGEAWGFNLVYTGSFSAEIECTANGCTRAMLGLNPLHLTWELAPGETFTTPECVLTYSSEGLGGVSRQQHTLLREHLINPDWATRPRPALINNWEATYFDMDADKLLPIAETAAGLGVRLFVMDDGWFGVKHPRLSDNAGLGDWVPNPRRFPEGLGPFVERITALDTGKDKMKFGIWVEPEMVNPDSELYEAHPDWVLHADGYPRTEARSQLVLNLGLTEVQDYIIDAIDKVLSSADISYVKWDNNRGMHELSHPSDAHRYILGLYRVVGTLVERHPDVLWEGCASGGGRFDAGLLYYWPQNWASDNTDALDRLFIQFGTTLAYPASAMGCHVSAVPNHLTGRVTPLDFRAHVALMGGAFGFELDLGKLPAEERERIPALVALAEEVNPIIVNGDMYKLARPDDSNWPAVQYLAKDGSKAVLLVYQIRATRLHDNMPRLRLRGLDPAATYDVDGTRVPGDELMRIGLDFEFSGDYQSKVVLINKC